jgi:hypothetical protein
MVHRSLARSKRVFGPNNNDIATVNEKNPLTKIKTADTMKDSPDDQLDSLLLGGTDTFYDLL